MYLPPRKNFLLSRTRRKKWLTCKKCVTILRSYSLEKKNSNFVQEKGLKQWLTWHNWSESVWLLFFRMISLGKSMTTINFRSTPLPQFRSPLQWGGVMENTMADTHHGCPGGVPCNTLSKEEARKKERLQKGPKNLPEGRTLMMMMKWLASSAHSCGQ